MKRWAESVGKPTEQEQSVYKKERERLLSLPYKERIAMQEKSAKLFMDDHEKPARFLNAVSRLIERFRSADAIPEDEAARVEDEFDFDPGFVGAVARSVEERERGTVH